MAMSPSPQLSPVMGTSHRLDRNQSITPPTQPLSKRDKRRTQLLERLHDVTTSFANNKDQYYRQQLQAIQVDTNLILHADPYSDRPLDDRGEEINEMVHKATGGNAHIMMALNSGDMGAIAGKLYSDFAREVNEAMEERDAALTAHQNDYEKSLTSLNTNNAFMIKLAEEEHRSLSTSLRDRLINSVSGRKTRLIKEKDELFAISESSALLMHPNQFSIANPSSPGGMHGKRSTRQRREIEDLAGFPDSHKRKRKAADEIGSPVPSRRHLENGFSTPIWTSEQLAKATNKGSGSPLYSIDKLFTEKELTMAYNTAAQAANNYIVSHKVQNGSQSPRGSDTNSRDDNNIGDADVDNEGPDSPPSAPLMERQYSHATRSTRGGLTNGNGVSSASGVDALTDLSLPANFQIFSSALPKMPPALGTVAARGYAKDTANSPLGLKDDDLLNDLNRIEQCKRINEISGQPGKNLDVENGDREILAAAVAKPGTFQGWINSDKDANGGRRIKAFDVELGGEPMSKQSSLGGSEMGGVPMSRTGTNEGSRRRRG